MSEKERKKKKKKKKKKKRQTDREAMDPYGPAIVQSWSTARSPAFLFF